MWGPWYILCLTEGPWLTKDWDPPLYVPGSACSPFVSVPLGSVCSSTPSEPPGPLASGSLSAAAPCPGSGSDTGWHTRWSSSSHLEPKEKKLVTINSSKIVSKIWSRTKWLMSRHQSPPLALKVTATNICYTKKPKVINTKIRNDQNRISHKW